MFRPVRDALVGLFTRPRSGGHAVSDWELSAEVRTPDPYVWRLPDPGEARWRRWAKRSRAAGYRLPLPGAEECWNVPEPPVRPHRWDSADDDMVRLYVATGTR